MSGQDQQNGWIAAIAEGGLPQIIAGPAGKAISRLVGASIEIPAAWLEQKAQAIRDETEARSAVMKALAAKSAELGLSDHALLDRGLDNLLGKAYREQANKEAVAIKTLEHLADGPAAADAVAPSDDWMNVFEGQAARATSEELRNLYAKILAGEIRKNGSFSLSTLHLVSVLDRHLASLIETIAPYTTSGKYLWTSVSSELLQFDNARHLEDVGFLSIGGGALQMMINMPNEIVRYDFGNISILAKYLGKKELSISSYPISRSGAELLATLEMPPPELSQVAKYVWQTGPSEVHMLLTTVEAGREVAKAMVPLPKPADQQKSDPVADAQAPINS